MIEGIIVCLGSLEVFKDKWDVVVVCEEYVVLGGFTIKIFIFVYMFGRLLIYMG